MQQTPARNEQTIAREVGVRGIGFLTEADVTLRFRPAPAGSGVVFRRVDLPGAPEVPAHVRHVVPRQRRTTIERGPATVEMVEHVMAALSGLRIDNCVVEIDQSETPGCDGSSRAFVEALAGAGLVPQHRPRATIRIDQPITVTEGAATLTAHPGPTEGLMLGYSLDYGRHRAIGAQSLFVEITPNRFLDEIAPCRTFLLEQEAMALRQAGLGHRLSESDILIFGEDGPINNTLRFPDECVRHKILDMVGDLALAGADLVGHVVAHKSGHQLNAELVRAILARGQAGGPETMPELDVQAIMRMLPHRYPFLLIDRVLSVEPGKRVVALKNVTVNEPFFQGHWPGRPIMPGVLILEAMAQAAGVLIAGQFDSETYDAVIAAIDGAKIRRPVVPGDQIRLEIEARRLMPRLSEVQATAMVDGRVAAEARIRFVRVEKQRVA